MSEAKNTKLTLKEAADLYALAKGKLPEPGQEFHGPEDAERFREFQAALFELERAAMRSAKAVTDLGAALGAAVEDGVFGISPKAARKAVAQ